MENYINRKGHRKLAKSIQAVVLCSSFVMSGCVNSPLLNKAHTTNRTYESMASIHVAAAAVATKSSAKLPVLQIKHFKMFGDSDGYAVTDKKVYRKIKSKWTDITPAKLTPSHVESLELYAVNSNFVFVSSKDLVFKTKDGGKSWQSVSIPSTKGSGKASRADFSFVNSKIGWMLVHRGYTKGRSPFDLYKTNDQGTNWKLVDHVGYGSKASHNLSDTKDPKKITFLDEKRGFITGQGNDSKELILYKTIDEGKSWTQIYISLPKSIGSNLIDCKAPQFFSANEGVMQVNLNANGKKYTMLYATSDQGNHWRQAYGWDGETEITFFNRMTGWANAKKQTAHPASAILFQTKSGGRSWTGTTTMNDNLLELQFSSLAIGFAINEKNHQLMQTKNGGKNWTVVPN